MAETPAPKVNSKPNIFKGGSLSEIAAKMAQAKASKPVGGGEPENYYDAWRQGLSARGDFFTGLSVAHKACLKKFESTCPEGTGKQTIRYVVERWDDFCVYVKSAANFSHMPTMPNPMYLMKFAFAAVKFYADSKPKQATQSKEVQLIAPKLKIVAKPKVW